MLTMILGFLKLVTPREWMILGAAAAIFAAFAYWNHHERAIGRAEAETKIAAVQAKLAEAQSANESGERAIDALKTAIGQCEAGRLEDKAAQAKALKDRDDAQVKLVRDASAARTKLQALLTGRCKTWADQPACGVTP